MSGCSNCGRPAPDADTPDLGQWLTVHLDDGSVSILCPRCRALAADIALSARRCARCLTDMPGTPATGWVPVFTRGSGARPVNLICPDCLTESERLEAEAGNGFLFRGFGEHEGGE